MKLRAAALLAFASVTTLTSVALAEDPPPSTTEQVTITRGADGRRIIVLPTEIVHGQPQRPYPFAISGRGPLGYTYQEHNPRFVEEVPRAVRRAPF